ncbi:lipopolysaccharide biosynthesis protein [Piscinibacter defluvii]|uniref:lipopolysaccharide biosynthesis protein n=1 Tax=Piscinibacter defluvii TaxID=1796922 RepID=UPI0013E3C5F9|nr:lipopolysaccharide biosynthesis protein [Piscinibacter defluvii]
MTQSVQRKMASGAIWMVLFKLVERSLGLISTLILARLLVPADFGIVAMAISFIAMAELLTAFGFDYAIIQTKDATESHFNTAWTCNVLLNLGVTALTLAMAWPIAHFYGKPEVVWVVCALAFGPLIAGAENIGVVAFRKELDFKREFRFQVSRKLIGFMVTVPLAFWLRSYWALVAGMLTSKIAGTAMSYMMHPFRPRFEMTRFRELFHFSRWLLFISLVNFLKERVSDFFIGRMHGPAALGSYNIAYELANLPTTEIGAPINRALLPGFAKLTTSDEVSDAYSLAVGVLAILALPAAAIIFSVAPFLVPVILGAKWLSAVPLMQVLAFNGALLLFHSSISAVLLGRGFAMRVGASNATHVGLLVVLLTVLSSQFGVVGAAYAALGASILATPVYLYQIHRALGVAPRVFLKAIARPLTAALSVALILHFALPAHVPDLGFVPTVVWLLLGSAAGVALYTTGVLGLWSLAGRPAGPERAVLDRLTSFLAPRFGGRFAKPQQPS